MVSGVSAQTINIIHLKKKALENYKLTDLYKDALGNVILREILSSKGGKYREESLLGSFICILLLC